MTLQLLFFALLTLHLLPALRAREYSPAVNEVFIRGRDGVCEWSGNTISATPTCSSSWKNKGTKVYSNVRLSHMPSCMYSKRTTTYKCIAGSRGRGSGLQELCVRNRTYYYITASCYRVWLNWEPCDRPCGIGSSSRYRFIKSNGKKYYEMQTRSCNEQACPSWSAWKPAEASCDRNCTREWSRQCLAANGSAVNQLACADATLSSPEGSGSNVTQERRPCPVHMCSNYVIRLVTTAPATTTGDTTASDTTQPQHYTTDSQTTTVSGQMNRNISVQPTSTPTMADIDARGVASGAGDPSQLDSTATMWIGFIVGFLVICILLLVAYITYESCRNGKLSAMISNRLVHSTTSQSMSSSSDAIGDGRAPQQFPSSSIDRWIARFREIHQSATIRKSSASSLYLQPNIRSDAALLNEYHGISSSPNENGPNDGPLGSSNVGVATYSGVAPNAPSTSRSNYSDKSDPIYADIPAYQANNAITDDIDSFTSDSLESLDDVPSAFQVPGPSTNFAKVERRRTSSSALPRPLPTRNLPPNPIRRCETERRTTRTLDDSSWGKLGPAPTPNDWQQRHKARARSLNSNERYNVPFQVPKMHSVRESSQEDLAAATSGYQNSRADQHWANRNGALGPAGRPLNVAKQHEISSPPRKSRASMRDPKQNKSAFGIKRKSSRYSDAGTTIANSEFGFHLNPSEARASRISQRTASNSSPSNAADYREPADSHRDNIEEAYSTYKLPFQQQPPHA